MAKYTEIPISRGALVAVQESYSRKRCLKCGTKLVHTSMTEKEGRFYGRYGYDLEYDSCPKCLIEPTESDTFYRRVERGVATAFALEGGENHD